MEPTCVAERCLEPGAVRDMQTGDLYCGIHWLELVLMGEVDDSDYEVPME